MDETREQMPRAPLERWELFEPRVNQKTMKSVGIRDPEGNYFKFEKGEEFAAIRTTEGENRKPYIKDAEGVLYPFDIWAKQQESSE